MLFITVAMNEFYFIDIKESDRSRNDSLVLVGPTFQLNTTFFTCPVFVGRCHNHLFPNIRPLPSGAIPEIKDILIHAIGGKYFQVSFLICFIYLNWIS